MGRTDSPLEGRTIFSFGVPRSGTYWLQRIVTAHPEVSGVPSESQLFYRGIDRLFEVFHHGVRGSGTTGAMYVDRPRLLDAARDFCDQVLSPYLEPGARYLAERTSMHVYCVGTIAEVYPDARLLHIIRDGRDVARSLVRQEWGPPGVAEAAEQWRSGVEDARAAAPPDRYREIRYERLLAEPEKEIADLYEWLELSTGPAAMEPAMSAARLVRNEDPGDPRLAAGKWRDSFEPGDLAAFMEVAGPLLTELGYEAEVPTGDRRRRRPRGGRIGLRGRRGGAPGIDVNRAQLTVDAVLEAIHLGAPDRLREHVAEDVRARVVDPEGERPLRGLAALVDWLRDDPVTTAEQLRADPHPGIPWYSVVLSYRLADGTIENRVLEFVVRDSGVEELAIYRF
ncbi:MAG TPA: sulfotransferase [Thermoleophilaceae bacterium]|jgi:hypothetical protein